MIDTRFTQNYQNTLHEAFYIATNENDDVNLKHIVLALLRQKGSLGSALLKKIKLTPRKLGINQRKLPISSDKEINFTEDVLEVIERSVIIAFTHNHIYVGTEHLLEALLRHPQAIELFKTKQNISIVKRHIDSILKSTSRFSEMTETFTTNKQENTKILEDSVEDLSLAQYAIDLTDPEIQKNIDPVIGRDSEIHRLINIIGRRSKNNPLLLGEPGVGKTAIVEGLAKKIVQQDVPDFLINKKIINLNLASLISGTTYRGEFEARLKQIIDELSQNPHIILFIDEVHNLIGAGATSGSMDAANILKPALARGKIRCIGATTFDEYKKHIEKDSALERRFQPIKVQEPTTQQAIDIIKGIKSNYENYHHVSISDDIIFEAVQLSKRYLPHHNLPDKAIDIIDEASAKTSILLNNTGILKEINSLKQDLQETIEQKNEILTHEDFATAEKLQKKEQKILQQLKKLQKKYTRITKSKKHAVSLEHVLQIISEKTHVPLHELKNSEYKKLLQLEKSLEKSIVGQQEVIQEVSNYIRKAKVGIRNPKRPLGSFIFLGPSGVGKTKLAKVLAQEVFGGEKHLIRIDMSELSESFNISKLVGSPAGYVGYQDETLLTDKVQKNPYSVVLFDEIEKAHPKIFNILLQILDEGTLKDASGKLVDFSNTLIILTSNIGAKLFGNSGLIGFDSPNIKNSSKNIHHHQHINELVRKLLSPELVNRINSLCIFNNLNFQDLKKIAKMEVKELIDRIKAQNITISVSPEVITHIATVSQKQKMGARSIQTTIHQLLENPLASKILEEKLKKRSKKELHIELKEEKITLT